MYLRFWLFSLPLFWVPVECRYIYILLYHEWIAPILIATLNYLICLSLLSNLQIRLMDNSDDENFKFLNERIPLNWWAMV